MAERFEPLRRVLAPLTSWCARFKRSTLAWTGLALAAVVLLSVNLASSVGLKTWSADLTQDRLFTTSKGTREILKSIDEPITAQLYFSHDLATASPGVARYFDRVRALFQQYVDISGGKLRLSVIDPEPFSDSEDKAVAAGLKGVRVNAEGDTGYFGLVATNATDNQEVIPFFSPDRESFLEYDVTKLIYALANPKKRTVGLMTSLPVDGGKSPMRRQPTHLPGMLTRAEILHHYAEKTGIEVRNPDFYYVFGLFRLGVIAQQIYYRWKMGQTSNPKFQSFGVFVTVLANVAERTIAKSKL